MVGVPPPEYQTMDIRPRDLPPRLVTSGGDHLFIWGPTDPPSNIWWWLLKMEAQFPGEQYTSYWNAFFLTYPITRSGVRGHQVIVLMTLCAVADLEFHDKDVITACSCKIR